MRARMSQSQLQRFASFPEYIEGHQIKFLAMNNPQESSDATNMLTGTAGKSDIPVVNITEQIPSQHYFACMD